MDISKAINYVKKRCLGSADKRDGTEWSDAMWTVIEAAEKQIPKKPIRCKRKMYMRCPVCPVTDENENGIAVGYYGYDYTYLKACAECGQMIDWSDYITGDNI